MQKSFNSLPGVIITSMHLDPLSIPTTEARSAEGKIKARRQGESKTQDSKCFAPSTFIETARNAKVKALHTKGFAPATPQVELQ